MASAFTKLFLPSHRKRSSNTSSSRRQEAPRPRFPTSSTFDLRHSIPEESSSATDTTFPSLPSTSKLTVQHLNHHVSAPISDATLRRRSLAIDAGRSYSTDTSRPGLPRSFSAYDVTSPLDPNIDADHTYPTSSQPSPPPPVDDDDDVDSNPIFLHLSEDPQLSHDWSLASLAIIPLARTLTAHPALHQDDLNDPHFVALHAFAASKLYKHQFVSVRSLTKPSTPDHSTPNLQNHYDWSYVTLTATIEADQKSVSITETTHASSATDRSDHDIPASATTKRKANIVSEITIYRTLPTSTPAIPPDASGFQVTSRGSTPKDAPAPSAKVRVVSVDLPIVLRRIPSVGASDSNNAATTDASYSSDPPDDEASASPSDLILDHIPPKRLFASDLALLANPSATSPRLASALSNAFDVLFAAAHQFTASFVYVKGFDSYNAHRIRRGIWFKAWKAFEERLGSEHIARLSVEAFHRIKSLLENIVMGLVHTKMYGPIQDQLMDADLVTEEVLTAYNAFNVSLGEFGVQNLALRQRPSRLADAIAALSVGLGDDGGPDIDDALATGDIDLLKSSVHQTASPAPLVGQSAVSDCIQTDLGLVSPTTHSSERAVANSDVHRRTPLQILQTLRAAIDEIGWAAERIHQSSIRGSFSQERPPPLGTDDLLPILSYVFVRARPSRLCSMLYYARTFQLTDTATSPELQWALVTCDAVIAYLRTDPLRLCRRRSSSSIVVEPARKGSHSQCGSGGGANETLSVRSMSSRSHQGSAAASSLQVSTLMARSPSARDSSSVVEATPPQSPRSPFLPIDPSVTADHLSASGSNSYFVRHGDVSNEHSSYAASEASPRLQAEGFKLPGLPASVSSRRNSRILQQRPTSIFSLSEDGDAVSLAQDTSLDTLDRRLSVAASQSPSRRLSMRDRTLSSSSSSTTHNDVQIRPQIVRTIKRSQAGSLYTSNRLERTSSNGSNASSSHVHVRVVGSPSMRAVDPISGRESPLINASPPKTDRRRSFDSWTAFSLFSSHTPQAGADVPSERAASVTTGAMDSGTARSRHGPDHPTEASTASAGSAGTATSSGWLSWGAEAISGSRRNSISTTNSRSNSAIDTRIVSGSKTIGPESDDVNCQPEGVEAPPSSSEHYRNPRRPASVRSTSSRASISDLTTNNIQWPSTSSGDASMTGSLSSLPGGGGGTVRSKRRYRGRFLSTSSATLAGSATPLPPQVDKSSADLARPRSIHHHRQSMGSLSALRATMQLDLAGGGGSASPTGGTLSSPISPPLTTMSMRDEEETSEQEMIPYGGASGGGDRGGENEENRPQMMGIENPKHGAAMSGGSLLPLFVQLSLPSPVAEARDPLLEVNSNTNSGPSTPTLNPGLTPTQFKWTGGERVAGGSGMKG
ncbi:uncharacterized protein UTRI_04724 [Ustilago trichophora]|uniref:VPS9 domain-containing protein n=1 Tax=Ustilago trichophora TaxID=86804 RepID=A0A5C3EF62_9BASI|nr:uncharacterized protein UTRI_04724 [Ustilago trichophora]